MRRTIDLDAVSLFVRVAETRSFRGAADDLGVPRSTVSRRIKDLEDRLGTRLLKRTTRSVSLTDTGERYLRACQPALGALEDASRAVTSTAVEARGRLRITAAITFGERFLGAIIEEYLEAHPQVEVDVLLVDRHVDIVQEGMDLAFRAGPVGDEFLVTRELGRAQLRCFASPRYLEGKKRLRAPVDLHHHDCIVYPPLAPARRWSFRVKDRVVHASVRGRLVVNSLPLSFEAAVRGAGIVRVPTPYAAEAIRRGEVVEVLGAFAPPATPVYVAYPSGTHTPPRVRAFIGLAMKHLEKLI